MDQQERRAMMELQLELSARVQGRRPNISADEVLELHGLLENSDADLQSLFGPASALARRVRRRWFDLSI